MYQTNGASMRRFLAVALVAGVGLAGAGCSTVVAGNEAKWRAEGQGFEVTEVGDTTVVVKIGQHCTADFTLYMDGDTVIGQIYNQNKEVIRGDEQDEAIGPDQYKNDPVANICY